MSIPTLQIDGYDYSEYTETLTPSCNGLNADGSGRDIQTGEMLRTKIADKIKWEVKMLALPESIAIQLLQSLQKTFYTAITHDPQTGQWKERTYYTDSVPFGVQRYRKKTQEIYYDGLSFTMTER